MFDFLLMVIGASGVAISIFAKIAYARRSAAGDTEISPAIDKAKQRARFAKPGRTDAEGAGGS